MKSRDCWRVSNNSNTRWKKFRKEKTLPIDLAKADAATAAAEQALQDAQKAKDEAELQFLDSCTRLSQISEQNGTGRGPTQEPISSEHSAFRVGRAYVLTPASRFPKIQIQR